MAPATCSLLKKEVVETVFTDWIPVISSNLKKVRYDEENHLLDIMFKENRVYRYFGVPLSVFQGLLIASSKGKYHHRYIKDNYPYRKVGV